MTEFSHRFSAWALRLRRGGRVCAAVWAVILTQLVSPAGALAIQLHQGKEGIIVHQVGHVIFLLSMVMLIFIITGRQLNKEYGWKMILISAILFSLWHLDTIAAHFFDNQIRAVTLQNLSLWQVKISAMSGSQLMVHFYPHPQAGSSALCPGPFLLLPRPGKAGSGRAAKTEKKP